MLGLGHEREQVGPRFRCRWVPCAVVLLTLALAPPNAAAADARQADALVDSIGVNTHTYYGDTAYSNFDAVKRALTDLGVRHIRENLALDMPNQYRALNELAAVGIKANLIVEDSRDRLGSLAQLLGILRSEVRGAVEAVEGLNEYDMSGNPGWVASLRLHQQALYTRVKSDPALSSLPVLGPSLVHPETYAALGDLSNSLDYGNVHPYPGGFWPNINLSQHLDAGSITSGGKPLFATETGYHNALNWHGFHRPASERAAAVYLPRIFLEYFRRGVARTFSYELVDEFPDAARGERESNFGLLRNDFSEKPAYVAIRNLIAILEDRGPDFAPAGLDYSVGGDLSNLRQVLLAKRDGSYFLALWREEGVWDPVGRLSLAAQSRRVVLNVEQPLRSAEVFIPNDSPSPTASLPARRPIKLQVGPEVKLVRLVPGAGGDASRGGRRGTRSRRIVLRASRSALRPGQPLVLAGRVLGRFVPARVRLERWDRGWRRVGRIPVSSSGAFRKKVRLSGVRRHRVARLRAVSRQVGRSRVVRVRVKPLRRR
jgi:hypothetical protein